MILAVLRGWGWPARLESGNARSDSRAHVGRLAILADIPLLLRLLFLRYDVIVSLLVFYVHSYYYDFCHF